MKVTAKPVGPLPKEALEYFEAKSIAPDFDLVEAWKEEHAIAFRVAGVLAEDLLGKLKAAVADALAEGVPYAKFAAGLEDVLKALGWWSEEGPPKRLRIVYQTNMRVARAAGQWARIQRTKEARPYLRYSLGSAEHHRPEHASWSGTVLAIDDPWWSSHVPPNGYGCKCWLRQVSSAEADRLGVSPSAPAGEPDEGWATNPGASRSLDL
jgi:uncharacterized protein with gpF-like domain